MFSLQEMCVACIAIESVTQYSILAFAHWLKLSVVMVVWRNAMMADPWLDLGVSAHL